MKEIINKNKQINTEVKSTDALPFGKKENS